MYYRKFRKTDSKQHRLLVDSYCKGDLLNQMCRRQEYESVYSQKAPETLAPNGYNVDTYKKIRIKDTRNYKRHKVANCVCLLQVVETEKTFSGWMIDISEGGVRLEIKSKSDDLGLCAKTNQIKILGYSAENLPISLTREKLKMVWQNNQELGCEFIAA